MADLSAKNTQSKLIGVILQHKRLLAVSVDICVIVAVHTFIAILFTGLQTGEMFSRYAVSLFLALIAYTASFVIFRIYLSLWAYAGERDLVKCAFATIVAGVIYLLAETAAGLFFDYMLALEFIFALIVSLSLVLIVSRLLYADIRKNWYKRIVRPDAATETVKKRLLIVGAGNAATSILNELAQNQNEPYIPVCAVDDDRLKLNRYILGVKIEGTVSDIPKIVAEKGIDEIFICIPSAAPEQKRRIINCCTETQCEVKILPEVFAALTPPASLAGKMKRIEIDDILFRDEITFDKTEVEKFIANKVVMITGGGGSIGSELCRQIAHLKPKSLIILDINENNAYDIQQELIHNCNRELQKHNLNLHVEIASIRDTQKVDTLLFKYKPNIIFHAAAHKHVPMMEHNPDEAIKNNILGTHNVMKMAIKHKVGKFVLISSDKAVNPTNIMGATKRFTEMLVQSMNGSTATEFVAVRFGNVLGSAGSIVPLFKKQIEAGGPVTVTHKDIKRFFMSISEAVHLLMQAAYMAKGGQVFVLDMGQPVKISDLAVKIIELMGYTTEEIPIVYTGLRQGEKLYEELLMDEEGLDMTYHKKIMIGRQERFSKPEMENRLEVLRQALQSQDNDTIVSAMRQVVPTYSPEGINNKDNSGNDYAAGE